MKFPLLILSLLSINVSWCQDQERADSVVRMIEQRTIIGNFKTIAIYDNLDSWFTAEEYTIDSAQERLYKVKINRTIFDTVSINHPIPGGPAYVTAGTADCMIFYYDNNSLIKVVNNIFGWTYYVKNEEYIYKDDKGKSNEDRLAYLNLRWIKFYNNKFLKCFRGLKPPSEQPGHLE